MSKTVHILCVNDFHAEIMEGELVPGCAKLAGAVRNFIVAHPDTLVVFGGDNYRGDPISEQTDGAPVTALMRDLNVKVSALGNHELDFGSDALARWQAQGEYSFLAANLHQKQDGQIPAFVKPYVVLTCAGLKIAFLGLVTREPLDSAARPADIHALETGDGTAAARRWVDYLRAGRDEAGTPDAVIALTHYGLKQGADGVPEGEEMCALCREVPSIDGAFAAHWHQFMAERINGVPVAQGGCRGQGFALLELHFEDDGSLISVEPSYMDLRPHISSLPESPPLKKAVQTAYEDAMLELGEVVGHLAADIPQRNPVNNEAPVGGTPITALAVKVMAEHTGAAVALFYSGWIINGLCRGPLTLYDLYRSLRFNNIMVSMRLSGRELLRNLETGLRTLKEEGASPLAVGGVELTANMSKPFGQRLVSARFLGGGEIEPGAYYTVVVDDSLAENGMDFDFSTGADRVYHEKSVRDCMIELIKREGTIPAELPRTVTLL